MNEEKTMSSDIAILLPSREHYGLEKPGAVSLTVRDYLAASKYKDSAVVWGQKVKEPFAVGRFEAIHDFPLFGLRKRYRYLLGAYLRALSSKPKHIEVHNRPNYIKFLSFLLPKTTFSVFIYNDPNSLLGLKTSRERYELLKKVTAVYCGSHYIKEKFLEDLPLELAAKIKVMPPALDIDEFKPSSDREKVILFVGRMSKEKGVHLFADAVKRVLPRLSHDWHVELVGFRHYGQTRLKYPYEKEIFEKLQGFNERVRFSGYIQYQDLVKRLTKAEIVVLPNLWHDPFGRVCVEAMAGGCAVISTCNGCLKEVGGQAAILMSQLTVETLSQKILTVALDEEVRSRVQEKCRERAQKLFSIKDYINVLDADRKEILDRA